MRFIKSDEFDRTQDVRVLHTGPKLTKSEGRQIFREMVRAEARNGLLDARRRKRLIQYAAALLLTPLEAGQIVTEIANELGHPPIDDQPALYRLVEKAADAEKWPFWLPLLMGVASAFILFQIVRLVF